MHLRKILLAAVFCQLVVYGTWYGGASHVVPGDEVPAVPLATPSLGSIVKQFKKCSYEMGCFCVGGGGLILDTGTMPVRKRQSLKICNEVTTRVKVSFRSDPRLQCSSRSIERSAVVITLWKSTGYHLMQRLIPTFKLLKEMNLTNPIVYLHGKRSDLLLGSNTSWDDPLQNHHWGLFKLLTADPADVRLLQTIQHTVCHKEGLVGGWRVFEGEGQHAWHKHDIPDFRDAVLKQMGITMVPIADSRLATPRLLILNRDPIYGRFMRGAEEIAGLAEKHRMTATVTKWEGMPFKEQLQTVVASDIFLGVHGNGLTMLIYLPPSSVVIQLAPQPVLDLNGWNYADLAVHLGHLYIPHIAYGTDFGDNTPNMTLLARQLQRAANHVLQQPSRLIASSLN